MVNLSNDWFDNLIQVVKVDSITETIDLCNISTDLDLDNVIMSMHSLTWVTIWNFR